MIRKRINDGYCHQLLQCFGHNAVLLMQPCVSRVFPRIVYKTWASWPEDLSYNHRTYKSIVVLNVRGMEVMVNVTSCLDLLLNISIFGLLEFTGLGYRESSCLWINCIRWMRQKYHAWLRSPKITNTCKGACAADLTRIEDENIVHQMASWWTKNIT